MGKDLSEIRLGETRINNYGQSMTIVAYRNCNDIDVQFEDGVVITNKRYNAFKTGSIPNYKSRLGKEKISRSGIMKIVGYRGCNDIDVQFEDGTIVQSSYRHFERGSIKNPNKHTGEEYKLKNNKTAKILKYNTIFDVTVQLDTGEVVNNVSYRTLQRGSLGVNPNFESGGNYEDTK